MARVSAADGASWVLCAVAAGFGAWALHIGWHHSILDVHGWRQSHTAISVIELLHGGPFWKYRTPIFGPPWSWPLEWPFYQWFVATVVQLLGTDVETTGRAISVAFFVGTLAAYWFALDIFEIAPRHRPIVLMLLWTSPLYIFWSRTFMIESTALSFAVSYVAVVHRATRSDAGPSKGWLACAAILGALAGSIKVTTFVPFLGAAGLLAASRWRRLRWSPSEGRVVVLTTLVVPILVTSLWLAFTDSVKATNPLAAELVWSGERDQRFGSMALRLALRSWYAVPANTIVGWTRHTVIGSGIVFLCAFAATLRRQRRFVACLACTVLYTAPIAVFMNLYLAHVYYSYENGILLTTIVGCGIVTCLEQGGLLRWAGVALFAAALTAMSTNYLKGYRVDQESGRLTPWGLSSLLENKTLPGDVVLVYGLEYSPELPYQARRRAIMDWTNRSIEDNKMRQVLAAVSAEGSRIGAVVACSTSKDAAIVRDNVSHLGFRAAPWYVEPYCALWVR